MTIILMVFFLGINSIPLFYLFYFKKNHKRGEKGRLKIKLFSALALFSILLVNYFIRGEYFLYCVPLISGSIFFYSLIIQQEKQKLKDEYENALFKIAKNK